MVNFLKKLFGRAVSADATAASSGNAKNRLEFLLIQDRAGLNSEDLGKFRGELLQVIEKYFDVDKRSLDIAYRREMEMTTLQIVSPVLIKKKKNNEDKVENTVKKVATAST